jgi:hypothetical protein
MHLWKVTNTESGDRPREYRCEHCGAVTRDDDRHLPPPCTEERERDAWGETGFLMALEVAAEAWLKTVRFEDLYERGDVDAAALANVLQRWLATRGKGPLVMFQGKYTDKKRGS